MSESSKYKLVLAETRMTVTDSCRLVQVCKPTTHHCPPPPHKLPGNDKADIFSMPEMQNIWPHGRGEAIMRYKMMF